LAGTAARINPRGRIINAKYNLGFMIL